MQWPVRFRHDTPEAEDYWAKTWEAYGAAKGGGSGAASGASSGKRSAAATNDGGEARRLAPSEMPHWGGKWLIWVRSSRTGGNWWHWCDACNCFADEYHAASQRHINKAA
eukprot:4630820-Lingulodinium_polyedra.AAC.1